MACKVSFYSYKGGVGRSLSLTNVAVVLARRAWRVVCIDFDLEAGGLCTIFGVERSQIRFDILDMLRTPGPPDVGRARIDLTKQLGLAENKGQLVLIPTITEARKILDVVQSGRDLPRFLHDLIEQIESEFNPHYILIDSRSGFADLASAAILEANRLVCVLRPNRQNAEGLRLFLDIVSGCRPSPSTFLVLSQVPELPQTKSWISHLEKSLGGMRKFDAVIPFAPELALEETVVALTAPHSGLAQSYGLIADWLDAEYVVKASTADADK